MAEPTSSAELLNKPQAAPVDTNVSIPRAIREAGERAEALQRQANGEAEPSVATQIGEAQQATQAPQEPPQQVQAPQEPQAPPQQPQEPPDWERNFNRLKGRYDKMAADVHAMSEQMSRLQNENASLRAVAPQANGGTSQSVQRNLLTEQEIADYGEDFIDVVRRAASEVAAPLQAEVEQLRGQLGSQQAEVGNAFMNRMNATIGGIIPNWNELNQHPAFVQWSRLPDVFSGAIRSELMQEAWNSGDAHRVAAFFRAFLAEEAAVDPSAGGPRAASGGFPPSLSPPAQPQLVPPANGPGVPLNTRLSLDQLAAPGRAHSVSQMPTEKPTYTAQDITRFYRDVAAGRYRGREQQQQAIDADISMAQHEGRIIPDSRTSRPMGFSGGR